MRPHDRFLKPALRSLAGLAALLYLVALPGCETGPKTPATPLPAPAPVAPQPTAPVPAHPLTAESPDFLKLDNLNPAHTPVRVGLLLPFSNGSAATRMLAASMVKAAEIALYDSSNLDILLIPMDEGSTPEASADAARALIDDGAEVILGPLFAQATSAAAEVARDHGVPVISFSTDRKVAGNGVYLLSFLPEGEVHRVVSFAAQQGHTEFAAMVPETAYGDRVGNYFAGDVPALGGKVADVERYVPSPSGITAPAHSIAQAQPDALLIAQGGPLLKEIASSLAAAGVNADHVKFMGTGLWDDTATAHDPLLVGGIFAAPSPAVDRDFVAKYHETFGSAPPQLASLAYDGVSLVALLASGAPYHRFTDPALTDPNGFAGVDGIFRFRPDGTSERGLAILSIEPGGELNIVSPAPTTFEKSGPKLGS